MRNARDSFLHYLADNLSFDVHALMADANSPASSRLQLNTLNVDFLDISPSFGNATIRVVLDVLHDDENAALDMIQGIWDLFKQAFYTPILDYSDPAHPATAAWLYWDQGQTRFTRVATDRYCHYTCTLTLRYMQG